jgi:hypothetical protein
VNVFACFLYGFVNTHSFRREPYEYVERCAPNPKSYPAATGEEQDSLAEKMYSL